MLTASPPAMSPTPTLHFQPSTAAGSSQPPTEATCGTGEAGSTCLLQEDKVYERTVHRPHMGGAPTCGGQGWVTASEAWRGPQHQRRLGRLASSQGGLRLPLPPSPVLPRMGKAGQEKPGVAQRLCYQGVSLRKGCDPLSSQEPLPGLGSRWQLWGPWAGWRSGSAMLRLRLQAVALPVPGTQKGAQ